MDKHKVRVWVQSPQSPQSPASVGHPPEGPHPPVRCRLRARSRFMQRSGSCSVVSNGRPSSTMLSRNWAKGVPRCSEKEHKEIYRPNLSSPHNPASLVFCEPREHPLLVRP